MTQDFIQMKNKSIPNAQIPDEPQIKYPKWLHKDICAHVQKRIDNAIYYKHAPLGIELGIYSFLTEQINKIKPALTNRNMEGIWNSLCKEDINKTLKLVSCLFKLQNNFHHGLYLRKKHIAELKSAEKIKNLTEKLIDAMEDNRNYYGHMQTENFNALYDSLENFGKETSELIEDFKEHIKEDEYQFCEYWPIGRKYDTDNSLAIFFIRKLYHFFSTEFGEPKYTIIEAIVNTIFHTHYTVNHIIKYAASMRQFVCDDSIEK